jgi:hypothetical protein
MTASRDASAPQQTTAARGNASAVAVAVSMCLSAAAAGLDDPVRAAWKAVPLREWADRVAPLAGMPVIVDRRLDPDRSITLDCRGEPLHEAFATAAGQADAELAVLASSLRLVPRSQRGLCERAEHARERSLARLPESARTALRKPAAWKWPAAARPRDLVAAVVAEAGIPVDGLDRLPHDHFPAADLPPLTAAERIDLVLAHFDRRVEWRSRGGAARGEIVPLDADLPPPRGDVAKRPQQKARDRKPAGDVQEVFSLRAAAPLDELAATVAGRMGLALDLDRESLAARGIAAREIVRLDVQNASRDELLDRVVGPLGLAWRIEAGRLRVFAPPAAGAE